mgnify:CR=1 FL=1
MFDVNVKIGHWPYRPVRNGEAVLAALMALGVQTAAVSSLDAVHYLNPQDGNDALAAFLANHADGGIRFMPLAVLCPGFSNGQDDLRRCIDECGMRGIVLYPNYHAYSLEDADVAPIMAEASRRRLPVFIQMSMEDLRRQFRPYKIQDVPPEAVGALARAWPEANIVALGLKFGQPEAVGEPWPDNLYFDISNYEHLGELEHAVARFGADRILYGSNTPMFNARANFDKLRCSAINAADRDAIAFQNAERIFGDRP